MSVLLPCIECTAFLRGTLRDQKVALGPLELELDPLELELQWL